MGRQKRSTKQKNTICDELARINTFFNVDMLFSRVRRIDKNIGMATIYRYLNDAVNIGELHSYSCNRKRIYSKGKKSHCHFQCEKTGKIFHFEIDNIDFLKDKIPGTITSFQLEVRGVCKKCKKEAKKNDKII